MKETEITCPSGMTGTIRNMKVKEESIFSDRKLAKTGGQSDALLRACWTGLTDPGPYDFVDAVDWSETLQADREFVLVKMRTLTYGSKYAFDVRCSSCRETIEWEIDLDELPVRKLSDEGRRRFQDGNRFETVIDDGQPRRVVFRLVVGHDERKLVQLKRRGGQASLAQALVMRIHEIEGVEHHELLTYLSDLSLGDAERLDEVFDEEDFGVETEIEIECPHCLGEQAIDIPFDITFFLPKRATRRKRSRRHRQTQSSDDIQTTNSERSSLRSSGESTAVLDSE